MCEWLSHGEWCDVKLLCGGRSFSAHRVVLASVSTFLRRILLSCPVDETPTFIVLPDFDLEAMSLVLYYIYNGEVIVQSHKVRLFLDIIQAMQIYIDSQYLPKIREAAEDGNFNFNTCNEPNVLKTNILTLGFEGDKDQRFFNLRRGTEMPSVLLQYSPNESDFQDNAVRCQNGSELRKSRLGNLKSPYGDRQRNSFLRDLFIETYPRNGNVNGLTEGVLAISNECYRSPASVLSSNANSEHLSTDDALSGCFKYTNERTLPKYTMFPAGEQIRFADSYNERRALPPRNSSKPYINCPTDCPDPNSKMFSHDCKVAAQLPGDQIPLLPQQLNDKSLLSGYRNTLDFNQSILEAMKCHLIKQSKYSLANNNSAMEYESAASREEFKLNSSVKILNQVLENPWQSRKPDNYRPFRRKDETPDKQLVKVMLTEQKQDTLNDNNNNIQTTAASRETPTERLSFDIIEPTKSSSPITISRDCFKCKICNQVFTSSESLTVHMRRHSTNARYTCGECGKTFSQLRNFKYHMSIHRGTREFAATCSVCGKYFNDRGYLSSHMKIHRNRKEYKCTLCPKSFNQRVAYNMHVRIHTGVKPHVCEECGKAFSRKMLLKQHQRTHSGERPYACPHCDKRFADRSNMTLHLRLHTGVKPFSCSLCPKSFTKKHHLKSHLNFHTGSKPYSCPRCKLAFTQSSNMRTHLKKCSVPESNSGNESQSNM